MMKEILVNQVGLHVTFLGTFRKHSSCWLVEFSYLYSMLVSILCFLCSSIEMHQVLFDIEMIFVSLILNYIPSC